MGMTRREFRGLTVLAAVLTIVVALTAITECSRSHRHAAVGGRLVAGNEAVEAGQAGTADKQACTETKTDTLTSRQTEKKKPSRKVKPMQPDRKSPLESPVKPDGAR